MIGDGILAETGRGLRTRMPTSSAIAGVVFGLRLDLVLACDADPEWDQELVRITEASLLGRFECIILKNKCIMC